MLERFKRNGWVDWRKLGLECLRICVLLFLGSYHVIINEVDLPGIPVECTEARLNVLVCRPGLTSQN